MAIPRSFMLELLVLVCFLALLAEPTTAGFNPAEFPNGFVYGSSTSAYQTEGSANTHGRGPSVWDIFAHDTPERISDGSNGDVAVDMYHRYPEDLKRMKEMGLSAFRFSISWSRIIPHGQIRFGVNEEGVSFYNRLINECLANGLQPFVTIFHWDFPQALEDRYGGFLSRNVVDDFRDYAEFCFKTFGDRVKYWITLNEPKIYSAWGYDTGDFAPGRCSRWRNRACKAGDSATEPYIVTHHLLLSHAASFKTYRDKYESTQKGKIGIAIDTWWFKPYSESKKDFDAAKRSLDFNYGWFMDPITFGDYPRTMKDYAKERLPVFTLQEQKLLRGSCHFIGVNYYSARFAAHVDYVDPERKSFLNDIHAKELFYDIDGNSIGPEAALSFMRVNPLGIRQLLNYTKNTYGNPEIYITENGVAHDSSTDYDEIVHDQMRIDYYDLHLGNVSAAMREDGVNVKGFFAWSFMDNFEWTSGYTKRFGLTYIDYNNNLTRTPKDSIQWFTNHLVDKPDTEYKLPRPLRFNGASMQE